MKKIYQIPNLKEETITLDDVILLSTFEDSIFIGDDPLKEIF